MNKSTQFSSSWVFDIDHTICIPDSGYGNSVQKYENAKPVPEVIEKIRELSDQGDYIILYTARRMKTCNNNIEKVKEAVEDITYRWLDKYDVPYDEVQFGKPYATHYYVDDKALNVKDFLNNV